MVRVILNRFMEFLLVCSVQRTDNPRREGYLSHIYETTGLPTGSGILYLVHVAFSSLWTFVVRNNVDAHHDRKSLLRFIVFLL